MKIFKMILVNAVQKIALCFFATTTSTIVAMDMHIDFSDGNVIAARFAHIDCINSLICKGTGTISFESHRFYLTSTPDSVKVLLERGYAKDCAHKVIAAPKTFWIVYEGASRRLRTSSRRVKP